MGTVRREGDWRLEKRREGVYEVTYRKEPQIKIHTNDAASPSGANSGVNTNPLREVSSYSEAEGLFEEKAHGPPPPGMENSSSGFETAMNETIPAVSNTLSDQSDLPPGWIGAVLLIAGSIFIYTFSQAGNATVLIFGIVCFGGGTIIISYGAYLFRTEGWKEAWEFLFTEDQSNPSSSETSQKKTPPPSEKLKNELFFERAGCQCEYCGEEFDSPDVHHIKPRKEGGSNDRNNLIVLCPNCHRKADNEMISRSKLRYKLKNK